MLITVRHLRHGMTDGQTRTNMARSLLEMKFRFRNVGIKNGDGQAPDLDLPNGTRWHQTEKGEVFFINDMARTTSWIHPRVEHQLIKEKVNIISHALFDPCECNQNGI